MSLQYRVEVPKHMPRENRASRHAQEVADADSANLGRRSQRWPLWVLARLTVTELLRSRMGALLLVMLPALMLVADFGATLALTDVRAIRLVLFAASMRLLLVAAIASTGFFTMAEDQRSGLAEFFLTRGIARSSFFLGRALGLLLIAGLMACLAGVAATLLGATWPSALDWLLGLWLELILVAWLAQVTAVTLREPAPGLLFVLAAYLLARTSPVLLMMTNGLISADPSGAQQALLTVATAIDRVLPNLAGYAPGAVLLGEGARGWMHLSRCLFESVTVGALLLGIGLIDFQRLVTGRPLHGWLR